MKVKFVPQNVEFEIKPGQSVMHVAQDNGMYIKSVCKGVPSCAECRVRVVDGDFNVLPPGSEELSLIGTGHFIDHRRLSCQLKCFGDITVDMTEQVAKEQGLMGGRKTKSRTQKDDRVEDAHAIRLNDSPAAGGESRRERTGGQTKKNPLKIGGASPSAAPVSGASTSTASSATAAPVAANPVGISSSPTAVSTGPSTAPSAKPESREPREARDPREKREPREPRDNREPREPRDNREPREPRDNREPRESREQRPPREAREPREPRRQNPNQNPNAKPVVGGPSKPKHHVMGEAGGDPESTEALPRAEAIPKPIHNQVSRPGVAKTPVELHDSNIDRDDRQNDADDDGDESEAGGAVSSEVGGDVGGEVGNDVNGDTPRGPRRKRRRGGRGSRGGGGGGANANPNAGGGAKASPTGGSQPASRPGGPPSAPSSGGPSGKPSGPTPKGGGRGPSSTGKPS